MLQLAELFSSIENELKASAAVFAAELHSDQPFINDLCAHVGQFHGKRLRPALLLLSGRACGELTAAHTTLAAVVEMVHIATLVHDDVLDESDLRRKAPTINQRWGNERAVLLGDYLISHSFHLCSSLASQSASRIIGHTTNTVCEGELMQVANRGNWNLSESTYFDIITRKTASLIGCCGLLGATCAGADDDTAQRMRQFGVSLGIAFQIVDDLLDLNGTERETGKSVGRDVEKGKLTLPMIHFLRTAPAAQRDAAIALLECGGPDRNARLGQLLAGSESLDYAQHAAAQHVQSALAILRELPSTDARSALIAMTEFVLARRN